MRWDEVSIVLDKIPSKKNALIFPKFLKKQQLNGIMRSGVKSSIMPIPSEITQLVQRVNQELDQIEQDATEGLSLARAILNQFPENFIVVQLLVFAFGVFAMRQKEIDEKELLDILELAKEAEQKTREMCELIMANSQK